MRLRYLWLALSAIGLLSLISLYAGDDAHAASQPSFKVTPTRRAVAEPPICYPCLIGSGPATCGGCMPVADALRDYIETTAVQVERGATTSLGMDVMALAPGTKLGIVWMDPINNAALLLGTPTVEQYAADGGLGTIQDTTPSGYYVVVPCAGACDSLNSVLTTLGQPDAKWEALEVPTKISDLSVAPQVGDTATADHLDLAWKYAEAAPDDKIAVVWSKEGKGDSRAFRRQPAAEDLRFSGLQSIGNPALQHAFDWRGTAAARRGAGIGRGAAARGLPG